MEKKPQFSGPRRPGGSRPRPGQRPPRGQGKQNPHATNEQIRAKEVRLVGDNVEQGIYPIEKALRIAREQELDLIEISPAEETPQGAESKSRKSGGQGNTFRPADRRP